ncbi:MAG: mechanosensitive ion channel [Erythrobacter sp.]
MQIGNYAWDGELAMQLAEKTVYAAAILIVTWALANAAKWAFEKLVNKLSVLRRADGSGESVGASLAKIASSLVWLFGLIAVLQVLGLDSVGAPINSLLNDVMGFIPNIVGAGLLLFIGLMIAGIVRDIAVTAMQSINLDKWANRGGVDEATGNTTISKTLGVVVYALIAIPVVIGALGVLDIDAISGPATEMLALVMSAIPNIIAAGVLLAIGYLISTFVVSILSELLTGLGIDMPIAALGVLPGDTKASSVIARIAQIGIILFFAIAATRMLGFPELTSILDEILAQGSSVLFGAVVIGVGFVIANVIAKFVGPATMQGMVVRYATILVFTFMGLRKMEVGPEIVDVAFSAVVIGLAVAGALAFGLGGRDWAAKKLEQFDTKD